MRLNLVLHGVGLLFVAGFPFFSQAKTSTLSLGSEPDLRIEMYQEKQFDVAQSKEPGVTSIHMTRELGMFVADVSVIESYGGFECQIESVSLDPEPLGYETYKVRVTWKPGADTSGCVVRIRDPRTKERALIELFMNYQGE